MLPFQQTVVWLEKYVHEYTGNDILINNTHTILPEYPKRHASYPPR